MIVVAFFVGILPTIVCWGGASKGLLCLFWRHAQHHQRNHSPQKDGIVVGSNGSRDQDAAAATSQKLSPEEEES
jgi:hypothetical protein